MRREDTVAIPAVDVIRLGKKRFFLFALPTFLMWCADSGFVLFRFVVCSTDSTRNKQINPMFYYGRLGGVAVIVAKKKKKKRLIFA